MKFLHPEEIEIGRADGAEFPNKIIRVDVDGRSGRESGDEGGNAGAPIGGRRQGIIITTGAARAL